ncbi:GNAT family N-acetyltransferase [Asanoa ishikariensis]|nr:GNAT family N-acetyltransferase [Asanoa ishikariensis]
MTSRSAAIETVPAERFLGMAEDLTPVYAAAFSRPPWNERSDAFAAFSARLPNEASRPGFTAAVTRSLSGALTGFAYGYPTPTPFPTGRSYNKASAALGAGATELCGRFEVLELAVRPEAEGVGNGRTLLDSIVGGRSAWLLTSANATRAVGFYRRRGWRPLGQADGAIVFASPPRSPATSRHHSKARS